MWSLCWFLLLLAGANAYHKNADEISVAQSKGLQVIALPGLIASTDLIQFKIMASLPTMDVNTLPNTVNCDKVETHKAVCETMSSLQATSNDIIRELSQVFVKLGPVERRHKHSRGLLPFIGKIRSFTEGPVNYDDLNEVIDSLNALGSQFNNVKNTTEQLIKVSNVHAKNIYFETLHPE